MSRELLTLGLGPSAARFWASGLKPKEETKDDVCVHLELAPGALCYSLSVCCRPCALKEPLYATLLEPLYKRV